jgi:hypothetical protein
MTDPKRWNETDDAGDAARQLVTTLSKAEPTASMRESVWAKVAATLPAGPGSGGNGSGSGSGSGGAGAISTGAKLMAAAALGAGALSIWFLTRPEPPAPAPRAPDPIATQAPPTATAPAPAPATATAPATEHATPTPTEALVPPPVPTALATPTPSLPQRPTPSIAADRLREEAEGVKRARQLLRDKAPAAALTELDRLARLFPNGPLEEEREVLTIEALVGSPSTATADLGRRRAQRFLAERPQSVHAARVRGLAGP